MTFSLFESAPDRKDCFIKFWIYFIYEIWKRKINVLQNFYLVLHVLYNLFDCISFFQRLLKTSGVKNDVAKESNFAGKIWKFFSNIQVDKIPEWHWQEKKKIKNVETTCLTWHKSCRQKLIYHASLRTFHMHYFELIWF